MLPFGVPWLTERHRLVLGEHQRGTMERPGLLLLEFRLILFIVSAIKGTVFENNMTYVWPLQSYCRHTMLDCKVA